MVAVAVELQHGVDHVFEHPRAGQGAFLGDVADEQHRRARGLGVGDQPIGALADLPHRAGRGPHRGIVQRLDGVDHDDVGPDLVEMAEDVGQHRLGHQPEIVVHRAEPIGPAPDLTGRLLTGDVEAGDARRCGGADELQQQGGLADARLAPDEGDRPRHEPAAEHPIDLGDARRPGVGGRVDDIGHAGRTGGRRRRGCVVAPDVDLLDHRVPRPAPAAAPDPRRAGPAALGAAVNGLRLGHGGTLGEGCDVADAQAPRLRRRSSNPRTTVCSVSGATSEPVTNRPVAMPSSLATSRCSGLFDR